MLLGRIRERVPRGHYAGCVVIIASTLAFTATAPAQQGHMVHYRGIGSHSCASFLATVSGNKPGQTTGISREGPHEAYFGEDYVYLQSISGYLTAINEGSDESHQITVDIAGVDLWLRNWCQARPADPLGWAAAAFVQAMHAR